MLGYYLRVDEQSVAKSVGVDTCIYIILYIICYIFGILPNPQKYPNTMTETVPSRISELVKFEMTACISYAKFVKNKAEIGR